MPLHAILSNVVEFPLRVASKNVSTGISLIQQSLTKIQLWDNTNNRVTVHTHTMSYYNMNNNVWEQLVRVRQLTKSGVSTRTRRNRTRTS